MNFVFITICNELLVFITIPFLLMSAEKGCSLFVFGNSTGNNQLEVRQSLLAWNPPAISGKVALFRHVDGEPFTAYSINSQFQCSGNPRLLLFAGQIKLRQKLPLNCESVLRSDKTSRVRENFQPVHSKFMPAVHRHASTRPPPRRGRARSPFQPNPFGHLPGRVC